MLRPPHCIRKKAKLPPADEKLGFDAFGVPLGHQEEDSCKKLPALPWEGAAVESVVVLEVSDKDTKQWHLSTRPFLPWHCRIQTGPWLLMRSSPQPLLHPIVSWQFLFFPDQYRFPETVWDVGMIFRDKLRPIGAAPVRLHTQHQQQHPLVAVESVSTRQSPLVECSKEFCEGLT